MSKIKWCSVKYLVSMFYALGGGLFIFFICVFQLSTIFHFHNMKNEKCRQKLELRFFCIDFPYDFFCCTFLYSDQKFERFANVHQKEN